MADCKVCGSSNILITDMNGTYDIECCSCGHFVCGCSSVEEAIRRI